MSGETASREELADALEEAAASSLEMWRSLVEGVTVGGRIVDAEDEAVVVARQVDLRRWYSCSGVPARISGRFRSWRGAVRDGAALGCGALRSLPCGGGAGGCGRAEFEDA